MIIAWALLLAAGVTALWASRTVEHSGRRRIARWSSYVIGVLVPVLIVVLVVPVGRSFPFILLVTVAALALVLITLWTVSDVPASPAERWAAAHGVALVDANRDFVERYVSEGHRLRLVCGFGGALAIGALGRGLGISVPVEGWVWLMVGYLGGVVWSEAWLTRLPAGTQRRASLTPRRVRDYLAGRLRIAQIVVPLVATGLGIAAVILPGALPADPLSDPLTTSPDGLRIAALVIGVTAGAVSLGVAWLQRTIVTKPQPDGDPDVLAADDAVRASSVHLLSGTGLGIVLGCVATQVWLLGDIGVLGVGTASFIGMVCTVAALIAWRYYGHRAWVVRRSERIGRADARFSGVRS